ncbi:hypothetical protein A3L11_03085 [Thermococcus siculi]|uniref:Uncharacterized protein n=1 Tax=Thermococcus siculi TaxID=72803 RepID=A0A2Z2MNR5_9EURY|nr:hypothetical protein [Thermococcus siculi]ASJ08264.1 hypothetical protein A3L11_03085 [Thermococcus siculi]
MRLDGDKVLVAVFTLQALVNLFSFGIGLDLMIWPILRPLPPKFAYLSPVFVFFYPILAVFALWFLSRGGSGKKLSYAYFTIGGIGSLVALIDCLSSPRGPDGVEISLTLFWLVTSIVGLFLVGRTESIPTFWTSPAMALFILSAFLGFGLSYMGAEDYYYHAIIPKPPQNANVTSAKPVWLPPPNLTNASG